jgi:hypothetical protein
LTTEDIIAEALKIIKAAEERHITIRVMGAIGCALHLSDKVYKLWRTLGRELTDIDFAGYKKQRREIEAVLEKLDYKILKPKITPGLLEGRIIFFDASKNPRVRMLDGKPLHGDVFLDKLSMNHEIDLKSRLHIDYPTIPLAELVLGKTQIVGGTERLGLAEKDSIDLTCVFLDHEVGDHDKETINAAVIAGLLSKDWGFYYTVTSNLKKIRDECLPKYKLPNTYNEIVVARINKLLDTIEKYPKSLGWKARSKIGARKKWYQDVEEPSWDYYE